MYLLEENGEKLRECAKKLKKVLTADDIRGKMKKCLGVWCNGNTWVSKTFVEGSSPSAPAKQKRSSFGWVVFVFQIKGKKGSNRAGVNDSPVGCQSRPDRRASSEEKEPYQPHQHRWSCQPTRKIGRLRSFFSNRSIIPRHDEPHSSCDTYP